MAGSRIAISSRGACSMHSSIPGRRAADGVRTTRLSEAARPTGSTSPTAAALTRSVPQAGRRRVCIRQVALIAESRFVIPFEIPASESRLAAFAGCKVARMNLSTLARRRLSLIRRWAAAAVFGVIAGCAAQAPLPDPNPSDAQLRLEVAGNHAIYSRETRHLVEVPAEEIDHL